MNQQAEIVQCVMDRGSPTVDEIADLVGMDMITLKQQVGRAVAQGLVKRDGERVLVDDRARCNTLVQQATGDYKAMAPPAGLRSGIQMTGVAAPGSPSYAPPTVPTPAAAVGLKRAVPLVLNSNVSIRKGVPLPQVRMGRMSPPCLWPFATMDIGDSFVVEVPGGCSAKEVAEQLRKDVKNFDRLSPGRFFAVRICEKEDPAVLGELAVGVWREAEAQTRGAHMKGHSPPPDVAGKVEGSGVRASVGMPGVVAGPGGSLAGARVVQPMGPDTGRRVAAKGKK